MSITIKCKIGTVRKIDFGTCIRQSRSTIISALIASSFIFIQTSVAHEDKLAKYYDYESLWKTYHTKLEFDKYLGESLVAQDIVYRLDTDIHRYDSELDLRRSFRSSPDQFDQSKCGEQLEKMLEQTRHLYSNASSFSTSKNLALIDLLDSYGTPGPQILLGSYWWLGSYTQCLQAKYDNEPARYCISKLRAPKWTEKAQHLKLALCLPQKCNSLTIKAHMDKLEQLVRVSRLQMAPFNEYQLSDVYCLPDKESPLRQLSPSARMFVCLALPWLLLVLTCNLHYEYSRMLSNSETPKINHLTRALSLRLNLSSIFSMAKSRNATQNYLISDQLSVHNNKNNDDISDIKNNINLLESPQSKTPNLNYIDGIKVMSMLWLISGHWLLYMMRSINNPRDFWSILKDPRYMAILSGIFPVDTFFVVTGFLVAYQRFQKREHETKFSSPRYWLELIYKRYARFMPMYVLVFWFTRDVSQFLVDGPLWDYATSNTTVRGICKEEPIHEAFLFRADFKPMEEHCVKPAWYLACDFHFLCVAPVFLCALAKAPRLGRMLIWSGILLSLSNQFLTIYTRTDVDWEVLINYRPLFPAYVLGRFWQVYVLPYNRITPFLLGLLTGHRVFLESEKQIQALVDGKQDFVRQRAKKQHKLYNHLMAHLGLDLWAPILVLISMAQVPQLSLLLSHTGHVAHIGTSAIMSLMRLVWSLAAARLIYVCYRYSSAEWYSLKSNIIFRAFNAPLWASASKIGLSVLLIQWEVIVMLAQSPNHVSNMKLSFLYSNIYIACTLTYALSLVGYLLFEAPIANLEQKYIAPLLFPRKQNNTDKMNQSQSQ